MYMNPNLNKAIKKKSETVDLRGWGWEWGVMLTDKGLILG